MLPKKVFTVAFFLALWFSFTAVSAKELNHKDWGKWNHAGVQYVEEGKYKKAIDSFNKVLKVAPNEATALINLGATYLRMNDTDKALEYLNKVIGLGEDEEAFRYLNVVYIAGTGAEAGLAPAFNARGAVYYKLADYDKAIADFKTAILLEPNYVEALKNLRNAYAKSGNTSEVIWNNIGAAFFKMEDCNAAIECFNKVIELSPDNGIAWGNRGMAYYKLKNYNEAIKNFQKVLELKPEDTTALSGLGFSYFNLEKYDRAIELSQKVLALDGENKPALTNLGNAYLKLGDTEKAADAFKKIVALNDKSASAWYNLGKIYFDAGDFENAAACGEKAVAIDENYVDAWKLLKDSYNKLNDSEKALKATAAATTSTINNAAAKFGQAGRASNMINFYILGSVTDG